jgi:chitinase
MKIKYLLVLALTCIQLHANSKVNPKKFRIVGNCALRTAMTADLKTIPFDKVTHINLTFLNPDTMGNFTEDYSALIPFVKAAHANKVKVIASIAGGTRHTYYDKLLKDDRRGQFINDLVSIVMKYGLDGINIDIEGGDVNDNYESFAVGMARALKAHKKILSASIGGAPKPQVTDKAIAQYDYITIMSYDHTGPWRPERPGPHASYEQAVADLETFRTKRAVPEKKLNLGVPFYGYGFGPELTSPVASMSYKQIITTFPGAELADQWNMPNGKIMYYNGIPTIKRKTALAKEKAGGISIWQILGDSPGPKSLLTAINEEASSKKR